MIARLDKNYIHTRPSKAISRLTTHLLFQGRPLTTHGRWINSLLLAQFTLVKKVPQLKKVRKPIFILGTGRSGTTILGKILSIHPQVNFLNEPKALWHSIYPEEDLIGTYSRGPARYRLGEEDVTPTIHQAAHRLYGYSLRLTRTQRVLDKYPEMIFRVPFIRAIFPDAKLIFLVRNGWDTVSSIATWSKREGKQVRGDTEDWWGLNKRKWRMMVEQLVPTEPLLSQAYAEIKSFTRHEDMAAVEWILTMQEGLRLMQSMPGFFHLVRYEELTRQTEDILEKLLTFCELSEDEVFLSYAQHVLKTVPHRSPLDLSSVVYVSFLETMIALDYPVERTAHN